MTLFTYPIITSLPPAWDISSSNSIGVELASEAAVQVDVELTEAITIELESAALVSVGSVIVQADIPSPAIVSELRTGARGNLSLDTPVSGTGRVAHLASGAIGLDFTLKGSGTGKYVAGNGELPLDFSLTGIARSSSVSNEQTAPLVLDPKIKGSAVGGVRAAGTLSLNDLSITDGSAYLGVQATGSMTLDFEIDGVIYSETFECVVLNTKNFALTEYDFELNSLVYFKGLYLGASKTQLFELTGGTDDGDIIDWHFKTGKIDLEKSNVNRLRHVWLSYKPSGDLMLVVDDGLSEYEYDVTSYGIDDGTVRVKIGKGIKSKYVQLKLQNTSIESVVLDRMRLFTEPVVKRR